jgi:hypothetical protein
VTPLFTALRGFAGLQAVHLRSDIGLGLGFRLLGVGGPKGRWLIGRYLLPDFARGLGIVGPTSGTSSHEFIAHPLAHTLLLSHAWGAAQTVHLSACHYGNLFAALTSL